MEIICGSCKKRIKTDGPDLTPFCECGSVYSLKAVLRWIVINKGEGLYLNPKFFKSYAMEFCQDKTFQESKRTFQKVIDDSIPALIL